MTASLLGDGVFLVALAWQVYELSNSPAALAMVGLAASLPHVAFLLLGGVYSDRLERRKVMVASGPSIASSTRRSLIAAAPPW